MITERLFRLNVRGQHHFPADIWICGKCGRCYSDEGVAEKCCTCNYCGKFCSWEKSLNATHAECRVEARHKSEVKMFAKAELVEWSVSPEAPVYVEDEYYFDQGDIEDAFDYGNLPEFGFATKFRRAEIDVGRILENISEEHHEDMEFLGYEGLAVAARTFNAANVKTGSWFPDYTRKVKLFDLLKCTKCGKVLTPAGDGLPTCTDCKLQFPFDEDPIPMDPE